jgi:exonuclease SbcC
MKLESISINNIRSIEKLDLTFPEGTILFYGDVGSGKSSVLKAVEFGLFGALGELPAESLLRRGQKNGSVQLTFSVDDKTYTIYRTLKRVMRKGEEKVEQPPGWFVEEDTKTDYTTGDLRLKILDLLKYSISRYRAHNRKSIDIYRYTVYTPQEELKQILMADSKDRFNILKDLLEIEKYEHTLENLDKIRKKLNQYAKTIDTTVKSIGSPEDQIPGKKDEIKTQNSLISAKEKEIALKEKDLETEKKTRDLKQEQNQKYSTEIAKIEVKNKTIQENNKTIKDNRFTIETLKSDISTIENELNSLPEVKLKSKTDESILESEIKDLREKDKELNSKIANLKKDIDETEEMLKNNICPRCKQAIHEKDRFNNEIKKYKDDLSKMFEDSKEIANQIEEKEAFVRNIHEYEKNQEKRNSIKTLIGEKQERVKDLTNIISTLEKTTEQSKKEIEDILSSYEIKTFENFKKYEEELQSELDEQTKLVESLQSQLIALEKEKTNLESDLKLLNKELKQLEEYMKLKEELQEKSKYIRSVSEWVSDQLPRLIRDIERTVLSSTATYFDMFFKEWFRVLVQEENIEIRIDPEELQPIVYTAGYESPFRDMSGGEKSALSLAYRLALNKVINTKHQDVKTKDLLILDEPTDGFSDEQVRKMQDLFDNLNMGQLIVISHERTLDSFVTNILNFKKTNHKTKLVKDIT